MFKISASILCSALRTARQTASWLTKPLVTFPVLVGVFGVPAHAIVVSDGGQATFSQSIVVPPGRAGMEPKVSLVYSSSAANGAVGYGWSIQGLSQITRCPAINSQDGRVVVRYEATDKLCLDGQRLIQSTVASSSTAGDALPSQGNDAGPAVTPREYRTENDGFSKIIASGSVGGSPAKFTVWSKAGLVTEYGAIDAAASTSDARVTTVGHPTASRNGIPSAWLVKRITDSAGNYMEFDYVQEAVAHGSGPGGVAVEGREWRISGIRYTASKTDASTANVVQFIYNDGTNVANDPFNAYPRADFSEAYHAGSKVVQTRLLRKVVVRNNGSVVREYRLTHAPSLFTKRALVSSIEECSALGKCLPATSFTYATGRDYFAVTTVTGVTRGDLVGDGLGVITADFNGDGRTDLLRWSSDPAQNRLYLATERTPGAFALLGSSFNLVGTSDKLGGTNVKTIAADVNADGLVDLVRYCKTDADCPKLSVWLGRGDGTFKPLSVSGINGLIWPYKAESKATTCWNDAETQRITVYHNVGTSTFFRDLDGDGRLDILTLERDQGTVCNRWGTGTSYVNTATATYYRGRGNGVFEQTPISDPGWTDWPVGETVKRGVESPEWVDVNADALPDAVIGSIRINSSGASFTSQAHSVNKTLRMAIDVNGDGKQDLVASNDADTYKDPSPQVWINRGDGTYFVETRSFSLPSADTNFRIGSGSVGSFQLDVNGDGLPDFISWDSTANPRVWFARATSNGGVVYEAPSATNPGRNLYTLDRTFFTGDFTGTGDPSFLMVNDSNLTILTSGAAATPDLMVAATNGMGLKTEVKYQALSQAASTPMYVSGRTVRADPDAFDPLTTAIDVSPPLWVVSSTKQSTAIAGSAQWVETVFMYQGMKSAYGRGSLGFASVSKFYPYANGELMVTTTDMHQDPLQFQYLGLPKFTATYTGTAGYDTTVFRRKVTCSAAMLKIGECDTEPGVYSYTTITTKTFNPVTSMSGLRLLNRTDYAYCDLTTDLLRGNTLTAPAEGASYAAPCTSGTRIRRPYQAQSVERHYDLGTGALVTESVSSNLEMSPFAEVKRAKVDVKSPDVAGTSGWSSSKLTENVYGANDLSKWFLARLTEAKVTSAINAPAPTKTAGANPNATSVGGTSPPALPPAPNPPTAISSAVLSAILQLLLED